MHETEQHRQSGSAAEAAASPAAEQLSAPQRPPTTAVAPWWHTALIAAALLAVSLMSLRQMHQPGLTQHHIGRYLTGMASEWALLLLVWWGLRLRRVRLAELLNFRRGEFLVDLGSAAIFWIAAIVILGIVALLLRPLHAPAQSQALASLAPQTALEMILWIALSISAGFCEEIVFRGYFFRQFSSPWHRLWIGLLGSSLLFGVSHAYEGLTGMIAIAVYGALFCVLAVVRNTLRPGMIAHAWHDAFTGALLAVLHRAHML